MPTFATFLASHTGSRAMARMNPHQQLVALRDLLNDQGFNFQEDKEYTKFMSMDSSFRNERKFVDDHHRMSMRLVGGYDNKKSQVAIVKEIVRKGQPVDQTLLGVFPLDKTKSIVSVIKRNASKRARSTSSGSMAAKAPKSDYEVIVGNIGTVYRGTSFAAAQKNFATYREQSQSGYGRAAGESVTLMRDGEVIREFDAEAEAEGSMARKNSTRRDVLQEDARKSGYFVETHSPGDGTTRYKFFSLAEMARKGISEREQGYFGPLNGVHTALGLAAAKKWLARAPSTHSSSSGSMAAKAPKSDYEVIVGNIGTVYRGTSFAAAQKNFATYREQSQSGYGRAAGESVTLMRDGEVIREFDAEAEAEGSMAVGASPRFAALVRGKLPGDLLDIEGMSVSTLHQYERNGWIRRSAADPRSSRWAYVTLTRDGYSAGN